MIGLDMVWSKTNGAMGSFYRSQHEMITVWKHGRGPHINNFELGSPAGTEPMCGHTTV